MGLLRIKQKRSSAAYLLLPVSGPVLWGAHCMLVFADWVRAEPGDSIGPRWERCLRVPPVRSWHGARRGPARERQGRPIWNSVYCYSTKTRRQTSRANSARDCKCRAGLVLSSRETWISSLPDHFFFFPKSHVPTTICIGTTSNARRRRMQMLSNDQLITLFYCKNIQRRTSFVSPKLQNGLAPTRGPHESTRHSALGLEKHKGLQPQQRGALASLLSKLWSLAKSVSMRQQEKR